MYLPTYMPAPMDRGLSHARHGRQLVCPFAAQVAGLVYDYDGNCLGRFVHPGLRQNSTYFGPAEKYPVMIDGLVDRPAHS